MKKKSESFKAGFESFPKYNSAPHNNSEFMKIIPNCSMDDDFGCRLRTKMYKDYIKGWNFANLSQGDL
jgi:hypothetical protein